jgi:hypothetical protein
MDTPPGFINHPGTEKLVLLALKIKSLPNENGMTGGMLLRSFLGMK